MDAQVTALLDQYAVTTRTRDISRAHRLIPRIESGTVWVNTHDMIDANTPLGGVKQSGIGKARMAIEKGIAKGRLSEPDQACAVLHEIYERLGIRFAIDRPTPDAG